MKLSTKEVELRDLQVLNVRIKSGNGTGRNES